MVEVKRLNGKLGWGVERGLVVQRRDAGGFFGGFWGDLGAWLRLLCLASSGLWLLLC